MRDLSHRNLARLALPFCMALIFAANVMRDPATMIAMLPVWRDWAEVVMLMLAATAVLAAIVAGVVVWRSERRNDA